MKLQIIILSILIFCGSLSACFELFDKEDEYVGGEILFQYEYVNYAWVPQHSGWLIDSAGNVWSYDMPASWNVPDSTGTIDRTAVAANLSACDSIICSLNQQILNRKSKLIDDAAQGTLLEPIAKGADMGAMSYYAYVYHPEADNYKRTLLKQNGDWNIENDAPEAGILYEWLREIQ